MAVQVLCPVALNSATVEMDAFTCLAPMVWWKRCFAGWRVSSGYKKAIVHGVDLVRLDVAVGPAGRCEWGHAISS